MTPTIHGRVRSGRWERDPGGRQNRRMDLSPFGARATAGTLRDDQGVVLPHAWTGAGVVAGAPSNGAQVLHLSVALCVLNDLYREAARLGVEVAGVVVEADGGFDDDWRSTGIVYAVGIESPASEEEQAHLLRVVDDVAEIPRAIRAGAAVTRHK